MSTSRGSSRRRKEAQDGRRHDGCGDVDRQFDRIEEVRGEDRLPVDAIAEMSDEETEMMITNADLGGTTVGIMIIFVESPLRHHLQKIGMQHSNSVEYIERLSCTTR